jgi:hypothetical protein
MQSHWANELAYYRCRFPVEYALASKVDHPRNVFVREDEVLPQLDAWLAGQFAPDRIEEVIGEMTAAQDSTGHQQMITEAHQAIRECETKMARYRAARSTPAATSGRPPAGSTPPRQNASSPKPRSAA